VGSAGGGGRGRGERKKWRELLVAHLPKSGPRRDRGSKLEMASEEEFPRKRGKRQRLGRVSRERNDRGLFAKTGIKKESSGQLIPSTACQRIHERDHSKENKNSKDNGERRWQKREESCGRSFKKRGGSGGRGGGTGGGRFKGVVGGGGGGGGVVGGHGLCRTVGEGCERGLARGHGAKERPTGGFHITCLEKDPRIRMEPGDSPRNRGRGTIARKRSLGNRKN